MQFTFRDHQAKSLKQANMTRTQKSNRLHGYQSYATPCRTKPSIRSMTKYYKHLRYLGEHQASMDISMKPSAQTHSLCQGVEMDAEGRLY